MLNPFLPVSRLSKIVIWNVRDRPIICTVFTILSAKGFRWVGGLKKNVRKYFSLPKTVYLKILFWVQINYNVWAIFNLFQPIYTLCWRCRWETSTHKYDSYWLACPKGERLFGGIWKDWGMDGWVYYYKRNTFGERIVKTVRIIGWSLTLPIFYQNLLYCTVLSCTFHNHLGFTNPNNVRICAETPTHP